MFDSLLIDAFVRDCNCNKPCEARKCRHPVYFVYKIKGVYDGKAINCRESDLIRRSERDSSGVEIKDEFNATDVLLYSCIHSSYCLNKSKRIL